jgi:hypothetical protein
MPITQWHFEAIINTRRNFSEASTIAFASSSAIASGFSHNTWTLASIATSPIGPWLSGGVHAATASGLLPLSDQPPSVVPVFLQLCCPPRSMLSREIFVAASGLSQRCHMKQIVQEIR